MTGEEVINMIVNQNEEIIILENWGDDSYMVVARGHHDHAIFESKVRNEYSEWGDFFGASYHTYFKATPTKDGTYYHPASPNTRGAFKATVASEGWEEKYGRNTWDRSRFTKGDIIIHKETSEKYEVMSYDVNQGDEFHAKNLTQTVKMNTNVFEYKLDVEMFQRSIT